MNNLNAAEIFKALSDENRIIILKLLNSKEMNAAQLLAELDITQPTLSHHTKILCESGLVTSRKEGKWTYYSISEETASYALLTLSEILKTTQTEGQTKIPLETVKADLPSHLL
ncbi:MAG: winged helix-turn-helix transcriptional regulator [Clostridia bacterium]|nr:winged helix-turn-helix transcriptional regulator [Clostridia bacterium]